MGCARGGADPLVVLISGMDARVRTASCRLAEALGLRVAGAIEKPIVPAALRALLRDVSRPETPDRVAPTEVPTAAELEAALEGGDITVAFQPKVALASRLVTGLEALARWQPAGSEPVPPDLFVPIAERHGLIAAADPPGAAPGARRLPAMARCATRTAAWRSTSPRWCWPTRTCPRRSRPRWPQAGVSPGALIAEITEGVVIANPVLAIEVLTRLRIKGVRLSIDDFGTGHSSLLSLMRLPFTELKIDRSFVACLRDRPGSVEDHPRHDLAGARAGPGCRGRGGGERLDRGPADRRRVRYRPGLSIRPTDAGRGGGSLVRCTCGHDGVRAG